MATPRKDPKDYLKVGRPTKYKPEYCQLLVEHMKQGGTVESFGSKCLQPDGNGVSIATVYLWFDQHLEFMEARTSGMAFLHQFYEQIGKGLATGQLKGNARAWEFLTKNMIGYRDRKEVQLAGTPGGEPISLTSEITSDDKETIKQILKKALHKQKA